MLYLFYIHVLTITLWRQLKIVIDKTINREHLLVAWLSPVTNQTGASDGRCQEYNIVPSHMNMHTQVSIMCKI